MSASESSMHGAHQAPSQELPADVPVSIYGGVIFATTGHYACQTYGLYPEQIALTPAVAGRLATVLRALLGDPDEGNRAAIAQVWNADEARMIPHGRIAVAETCVSVSIEPLGAGTSVTLHWGHTAAFIVALEQAVYSIRSGAQATASGATPTAQVIQGSSARTPDSAE